MTLFLRALRLIAVLAALGAIGYVLYTQAAPLLAVPCKEPIPYALGNLDQRFGISEAELEDALSDAAAVWEEAAGIDLFVPGEEGAVTIHLVYGAEQRTAELGEVISEEQADYDAKKAELEELKQAFERARNAYEREAAGYDEMSAEYHEQVNYWNEQGGAPPEEYEKINKMRGELERRQAKLKDMAEDANTISLSINGRVDELNAFAKKLNAKVDVYNRNAGDEFDQGDYQEDADGKRISVYEFTSGTDLRRVLAHELGHALGIGHVENPSSVMYSYNAGSTVVLSDEDKTALKLVCRLR